MNVEKPKKIVYHPWWAGVSALAIIWLMMVYVPANLMKEPGHDTAGMVIIVLGVLICCPFAERFCRPRPEPPPPPRQDLFLYNLPASGYKVICCGDLGEMQYRVDRMIEHGWRPIGGVSAQTPPHGLPPSWSQAVVKP